MIKYIPKSCRGYVHKSPCRPKISCGREGEGGVNNNLRTILLRWVLCIPKGGNNVSDDEDTLLRVTFEEKRNSTGHKAQSDRCKRGRSISDLKGLNNY